MPADDHAHDHRDRDGVPAPGDLVNGKYAIEHELAEGGMGVLFAATHRDLQTRVAIKFLKPKYAKDDGARQRFLREARAAAAITSEHAARIQDVGETDVGLPFIVMELLQGADLDQLLAARKTLPAAEAIGYVLEACEAIAEAHAAGIVHRDLKPSNLFLAERANGARIVKVLDFGISKSTLPTEEKAATASLTAPNTLLGSPQYMAPEQVRNAKTVDGRADVWALGVILQELITGAPPFAADALPMLYAKILSEPPTPMRKLAPDAPAGLGDVVARCLAKEPELRLASVADLATALAPFAPPGSEKAIERIRRALGGGAPGPSLSPAFARSAPTTLTPSVPVVRRPGRVVAATSVVLGVAIVAAVLVHLSAGPGAGEQASAATALDAAVRPTPPATTPATTVALSAKPPASAAVLPPDRPGTLDAAPASSVVILPGGRPSPLPVAPPAAPPKVKDISKIQLMQ